MRVLFFAQSRHAAGCAETSLETDRPIDIPDFWNRLVARHAALAAFRQSSRLARRETYLTGDEWLAPDDEIAVLPPVSGG